MRVCWLPLSNAAPPVVPPALLSAAQAPRLPSGLHTIFWESDRGPTLVSGHALEVSNHWGPVDVHQGE